MLEGRRLVARAREIAERAHDGQVRDVYVRDVKVGMQPFIAHPERVANLVRMYDDAELEAAAWLHDVIEDTEWTADELRNVGIPDRVVWLVEAVTRRDGETYAEFIRRIWFSGQGPIRLKVADMTANLSDGPPKGLRKRYHKSFAFFAQALD